MHVATRSRTFAMLPAQAHLRSPPRAPIAALGLSAFGAMMGGALSDQRDLLAGRHRRRAVGQRRRHGLDGHALQCRPDPGPTASDDYGRRVRSRRGHAAWPAPASRSAAWRSRWPRTWAGPWPCVWSKACSVA
ncbi:hypothetical protein ACRAWD_31720 [Caulobacter segnis]